MTEIMNSGRPRVVQYLRMSTDKQIYSIENQQEKITEYAKARGYEIIDTYADAGCSGLTLKERQELNRLLRDVADPNRNFSTILVLDVSRWGRFQDPDQHAAYEFICREMGVHVEYVEEAFPNDGTFASSMLKHMKRIMAGEYSRELSARVSYAKLREAARGYKQGGTLTFGLRRLLVDSDGNPKQELSEGQQKSITEDKVLVIPGPVDEQKVVRNIFKLFLSGEPIVGIVRRLNRAGIASTFQTPWSQQKIITILQSELYTGVYVYNKSSTRLKSPRVLNPPSVWVRVPVFKGIITERTFKKAQEIFERRTSGNRKFYSSEKMLAELKELLLKEGYMSSRLIDSCPSIPTSSTYCSRFGNMENIYALLNYEKVRKKRRNDVKRIRPKRFTRYTREELIAQLQAILRKHGYLSRSLLERPPYAASAATFRKLFGNLYEAFRAAGYDARKFGPGVTGKLDKTDALRKLKQLHDENGYITAKIVASSKTMPSLRWYNQEFGNLTEACAHAGIAYDPYDISNAEGFHKRVALADCPKGSTTPAPGKVGRITNERLFEIVRRIYDDKGYVTGKLISDDPEGPSLVSILKHYAFLAHLYAAAGLPSKMRTTQILVKELRPPHSQGSR